MPFLFIGVGVLVVLSGVFAFATGRQTGWPSVVVIGIGAVLLIVPGAREIRVSKSGEFVYTQAERQVVFSGAGDSDETLTWFRVNVAGNPGIEPQDRERILKRVSGMRKDERDAFSNRLRHGLADEAFVTITDVVREANVALNDAESGSSLAAK